MAADLPFASIHQLAALIQKKGLSPVELTTYYLERIARGDRRFNAYLTVMAERALAAARAAEIAVLGGHYLGPLHGIPLAIKDLIDLAGVPTTAGSVLFKDRVAQEDAPVARRLARAGAVFLGKTQQFPAAGFAVADSQSMRRTRGARHRLPRPAKKGSFFREGVLPRWGTRYRFQGYFRHPSPG